MDLHAAQYSSVDQMRAFETGRTVNCPQMELAAERISVFKECFNWTASHATIRWSSVNSYGLFENMLAMTQGPGVGETSIPYGERTLTSYEGVICGDAAHLAWALDALRGQAGPDALVEAAAVMGNFQPASLRRRRWHPA